MIFRETAIAGVVIVEPELREDHRGFFALTWGDREFAAHGLDARFVECGISFNKRRGTLRGLHFQLPPHAQDKLIRCTRGAIYEVAIDVRPESPTFRQHVGAELTAENRHALYIAAGLANGFQSLEDNAEVFYHLSGLLVPAAERGIRYDDPAFGIRWPIPDPVILERDRTYPDFVTPER